MNMKDEITLDPAVERFFDCNRAGETVVDFSEIAVETIKDNGCFLDYARNVLRRHKESGMSWEGDWGNLYLLLKSIWEQETHFGILDCQAAFYKLFTSQLNRECK